MTASSIVLASIVASLRVPAARFLAGGIGAGLTVAALSNTCTMSRALSLLPYNRGPAAPSIEQALEQLPQQRS